MWWENLFLNLDEETIKLTLEKYNIEIPDNFIFSDINIIIGANGSGKTRLLRAVRELYARDNTKDILYGYFPALSDCKVLNTKDNLELPECTLYDSMYMEDVTFQDFFKEIEAHNEEFISELLTYHSQRQKMRGEKALNIVKNSFFVLTNKELVIENKEVYIRDCNGVIDSLENVLVLLSPGELMLFYMSIFLAIQQNGKKNKVIILDEPECHLHPKALTGFVKQLTQNHEFCAVWLATHSLFVVPEFQFENIAYIENGKLQRRTSSTYQSIFTSLLGDEKGKIQTFFASLSQWQYCEFIAECFTDPTVIDTVNPQEPLRVLDCGGGSGRLGLSLEAADPHLADSISYDIYDKNPTYKGEKFNVYTDVGDIKRTYNCVVMMNFLHEVAPGDWKELFHRMYTLMEKGAYLLFVEVEALAQGERPNQYGYFVFGQEELEILFQSSREVFAIKHKNKQKSVGIIVSRLALLNVTQESILDAIRHLGNRTLKEIKDIKELGDCDARKARRYAFLSQQFLNIILYLDKDNIRASRQLKGHTQTKKKQGSSRKNFRESLDEVMRAINNLGSVSKEAKETFCCAMTAYREKGGVSKKELEKCWKYVLAMEKAHAPKEMIACLLAALALMGDLRGKNRLKNNRYTSYLPKELKTIVDLF